MMKTINRNHLLSIASFFIFLMLSSGLFQSCQTEKKLKALIITGQSYHDWMRSTEALELIMENSGVFSVEIAKAPTEGKDMATFQPNFSAYDVIVLNYYGDSWTDQTRNSFVDYVNNGGGVVVYHGASMAFPEWKEYNEITGLGGWGDRDENAGPYWYWLDGEMVLDETPGLAGQHPAPHEFLIVHRNPDHPILKGLPDSWLHGEDELYGNLRGPAENLAILATAFSDTANGGTGRDEPILFTINYGQGRVFHTTLGHPNPESNESSLHCAGFITTFLRGAEWAATGDVTQPVHPDFPNSASTLFWQEFRPLTLDELMTKITTYDIGKSRKYLADLSNRIRKSDGSAETMLDFEKKIVRVCESDASIECKKYLCRELSWMGSDYCIPVLTEMTNDPDLKEMAEFTLARVK